MASTDPAISEVAPQHRSASDEVEKNEKNVLSHVVSPSILSEQQPRARRGWLSGVQRKLGLGGGGSSSQVSSEVYQPRPPPSKSHTWTWRIWKFFKFLGPGAVVSVAYIDPDNYQTAISAGASFQYKLLFMVLVSNLVAIYFQSLSVKLGTVTGMDLAQMNHRYMPRWLELSIYAIAEASIICTDLGQVIGTAIALNILIPRLPLPAACVLSVAETLLILLFYSPTGQLRRIRLFEIFVALLVIAVFCTVCVALSMVTQSPRDVLLGYVPSREIFVDTGLYESCAILGGTLMPHALYVGTALSRARLHEYDHKHNISPSASPSASTDTLGYRPSLRAIKSCLGYSIAELVVTLFIVAVFVNSALVVISGSAFYNPEDDNAVSGDLYDLYNLFSDTISPASGVIFAVSLLFSGVSAGIVSTMAGQIVMEGALKIKVSPFLRRLITRCVAIIPALIIAVSVGQEGLSQALVACNYILAIALIFIISPLVYFTSFSKYMSVPSDDGTGTVSMRNNLPTSIVAWILWLLVTVMDIATIVLVAMGIAGDD